MTLFTKNAAWINCKTREEATAQFTRKNGWQANMAGNLPMNVGNVVSGKKYVRSILRSEMSWRKLQQNFWDKLL